VLDARVLSPQRLSDLRQIPERHKAPPPAQGRDAAHCGLEVQDLRLCLRGRGAAKGFCLPPVRPRTGGL
jgi:hypothetical protein